MFSIIATTHRRTAVDWLAISLASRAKTFLEYFLIDSGLRQIVIFTLLQKLIMLLHAQIHNNFHTGISMAHSWHMAHRQNIFFIASDSVGSAGPCI